MVIDATKAVSTIGVGLAATVQRSRVDSTSGHRPAGRRTLVVLAVNTDIRGVVACHEEALLGHLVSHLEGRDISQLQTRAILRTPVDCDVCVAVHTPGGVVTVLDPDEVDAVAIDTGAVDKQARELRIHLELVDAIFFINNEGVQGVDGKEARSHEGLHHKRFLTQQLQNPLGANLPS